MSFFFWEFLGFLQKCLLSFLRNSHSWHLEIRNSGFHEDFFVHSPKIFSFSLLKFLQVSMVKILREFLQRVFFNEIFLSHCCRVIRSGVPPERVSFNYSIKKRVSFRNYFSNSFKNSSFFFLCNFCKNIQEICEEIQRDGTT